MGMEMEHIASEMTDRQMNLMRTWRGGGQRRSVCHNGRIWEGSAVSSATVILSVNGDQMHDSVSRYLEWEARSSCIKSVWCSLMDEKTLHANSHDPDRA